MLWVDLFGCFCNAIMALGYRNSKELYCLIRETINPTHGILGRL